MQARYIGARGAGDFYGVTLDPGVEFTVPDGMEWRIRKNPHMFKELAEDAEVIEETSPEEVAAEKPRRRGRPRKKAAE